MKNQRNERGITLVALVVTIVVLLILAGITIVYVMGDNGVFGKAQSAKKVTTQANFKEAISMALFDLTQDLYDPTVTTKPDPTKAKETITKYLKNAGFPSTGYTIKESSPELKCSVADGISGEISLNYNGAEGYVQFNTKASGGDEIMTESWNS